MIVEHVDFWAVPVTDLERSKTFYGETLGLPMTGDGQGFPEFKLGDNGFLYLLSLEAIGGTFRGPHDAGFALRVPTLPRRGESSRRRASSSTATCSTPAFATCPSSPTPTGTRSCCTGGTHRMIDVQRTDFVAVPAGPRPRRTVLRRDARPDEEPELDRELDRVRDRQHDAGARLARDARRAFMPLPIGSVVFRVTDVAEARAKLEAAGVEFLGEPWDSGVCHGAAFKDPDGNGLALHHRYEPYLDGSTP